jgi:short-subunit dehydrogenase
MDLNGKSIVLTGAASGIGHALLAALCAYDVRIVAADRNSEALQAAISALPAPANVQPFSADLGDPASVEALFAFAGEALGGIDVFIANAGFAYYEAFDGRWEHIEALYRVNVFSPLAALDWMLNHTDGRTFTFVMTASAMAHLGMAGYALYSSTKAALDRFADAFRLEAPPNARLMLVYPITTRTAFFAHDGQNAPVPWPSQTPDTVATAIIRGLEHDQRSVKPSRLFAAVSVLNRVLPILWIYQRISQRSFRAWITHLETETT